MTDITRRSGTKLTGLFALWSKTAPLMAGESIVRKDPPSKTHARVLNVAYDDNPPKELSHEEKSALIPTVAKIRIIPVIVTDFFHIAGMTL